MARKHNVPAVDFVKGYLFGHKQGWNVQQVADHLGMEKGSVTVRASQMRNGLGIELPSLAQARKKVNISELARMVSEYETSMSDLDGKENVTISTHLDPDDQIPDDNTQYVDPNDQNDGRRLVGSM